MQLVLQLFLRINTKYAINVIGGLIARGKGFNVAIMMEKIIRKIIRPIIRKTSVQHI